MIERHYDDESLIALLPDDHADAHVASCVPCADKFESYRDLASVLGAPDVWDARELSSAPVASTIATLRAFASSMEAEDVRAGIAIELLLEGPRELWMPRLAQHPEWRSAGLVRKLIQRAHEGVDTMPPDAVAIAELATEIADHLDVDSTHVDTVHHLRAQAWLEKAFTLNYTSRFAEALAATDRAERNLERCVVDEYDRARIGIVRTIILEAFDRLEDAAAAASDSAATFVRFEDAQRTASATIAEALILFRRNRHAEAERALLELERRVGPIVDDDTHARILANLGYAAWQLGRIEDSIHRYEAAVAILREIGNVSETLRIRWAVAVMLTESGRTHDALERLSPLTAEMERLGMTCEAAVNMLNVAELLLVQERFAEVEDLCRTAMEAFERSGTVYRDQAMTALAFMREAAQQKNATKILARSVREYIHRLPAEPNLLFAPPPM